MPYLSNIDRFQIRKKIPGFMQRSISVHAQSFQKIKMYGPNAFYHKRLSLLQEKLSLMELCPYIAARGYPD